jgi:hypothetical protein
MYPAQYNDRLLLGLKGTMSEAELYVLKQRLAPAPGQAQQGTARRVGQRLENGEIALDADEQVQHVVRLIFRKFDELGTLHAVLQHLMRHEIRLGVRERCGKTKGRLVRRSPRPRHAASSNGSTL